MANPSEAPPKTGCANLLSQTVTKSNTTINADSEADTTHIKGNISSSIMEPVSTPQPKTVNQADLSQLPPTPGTVLAKKLGDSLCG